MDRKTIIIVILVFIIAVVGIAAIMGGPSDFSSRDNHMDGEFISFNNSSFRVNENFNEEINNGSSVLISDNITEINISTLATPFNLSGSNEGGNTILNQSTENVDGTEYLYESYTNNSQSNITFINIGFTKDGVNYLINAQVPTNNYNDSNYLESLNRVLEKIVKTMRTD